MKSLRKIFFIVILSLFFISPNVVSAVNDVTIDGIVSFELQTADTAVLTTILASAGGQITSMDVQSNYIDLTIDNLSTITFNTTEASRYFRITKQSGSDAYTTAPTCVTSVVTIVGTGATVVLRLEVYTTPPGCASGGGGGGGGGGAIYPTNYSVSINSGQSTTSSADVILTLRASNADYVKVSNKQNFEGAEWLPFTSPTNMNWTIESGDGEKTVYVLYKSSTGNLSNIIIDTIELKTTPIVPPVEPPVPPEEVCQIDCQKVSYDLYIINPDGTERHSNTNWVRVEAVNQNVTFYNFEDSGSDFDYNDVVIKVDRSECPQLSVKVVSHDASWHHTARIRVSYNNIFKKDILVIQDTYQAEFSEAAIINLNDFPDICQENLVELKAGDLIKGSSDAVYYYGSDSKRHAFPNKNIYMTYYTDFSAVKTISDSQLASIPLGKNMTYKPGARMVKVQTDPKVYAVDEGAILRWLVSEEVAKSLYGADWAQFVDDLSDAFFADYKIGAPIYTAKDYTIDLSWVIKAPEVPSPAACEISAKFTIFMTIGTVDEQVRELQKLLKCLGYFPSSVEPTATFGPITEEAVKKFQAANGLAVVGYVGPNTREVLNTYYK